MATTPKHDQRLRAERLGFRVDAQTKALIERAAPVRNTPGHSLFVRLRGPDSGKGAAGKWTNAATGEHGDLLDLIALNRGLDAFATRSMRHGRS